MIGCRRPLQQFAAAMLLCALLVFSPAHASEGASDAKNRDLIINGISAPETRYPYAVSLQYNRQHFCGGSLVAPNVVVTAAHCTSTPGKVTLGRYDLDSIYDYDYEVLDVTSKIVHPAYDKATVEHDLALLVLERDSVHPYIEINVDGNLPANGEELAVMVSINASFGWNTLQPRYLHLTKYCTQC